jgi:mevalonate pyrophosphate decarboxylase
MSETTDVLSELDAWINSRAEDLEVADALIERARDEIAALRELAERNSIQLHADTLEIAALRAALKDRP